MTLIHSRGSFSYASECANLTHSHERLGDVQPYGDIDGLGVMISFIGTGCLVVFVLLVNYMVVYDPEAYPFPTHKDAEQRIGPSDWWRPNPIDVMFLSWIRKIARKCPSSWHIVQIKKIEMAFNRVILIMCDIQIFTGISVLISGFVLLPKGIQAYHWQLIVYIAWFSSTTHLSAMTVLRSYLSGRRVETSVRFSLMLCLLIMLIIAFIPTAFSDWATRNSSMSRCSIAKASSPAICFFNISNARNLSASLDQDGCARMPPSNPAGQSMVLSLVLLIYGFVSRTVKLFKPLSMAINVYIRRPMSKKAQQVLIWLFESPEIDLALGPRRHEPSSGHNVYFRVLRQPCVAGFLSFRITTDLIGSMLAEIYWLMVLVAWGTTKLLETRKSDGGPFELDAEKLDAWTFGQILPVLLLIAPVWSLVATFVFSDRSEGIKNCVETHGHPLMAEPPAAQTSSTPVLFTNSPAQGVADSRSIRENQVDPSANFITNRYMSCHWIGPCLVFPCLAIFGVTFTQLILVEQNIYTLKEFWIDRLEAIYIIVLVYPFAFHCSILMGLVYEEWLLGGQSTSSRSNAFRALLWLTLSIVWVLFIMVWYYTTRYANIYWYADIYGYVDIYAADLKKKFRYGGILGGTAVLHLVYILVYFLQAFRKRPRCFGN